MSERLSPADIRLVSETVMFQALDNDLLGDVLADTVIERHDADKTLFTQGDSARDFFIMLDGWVKLYRLTSQGNETVIGVFTRGQSFGEAVAIVGTPFPTCAETVTETKLVRVPCEKLRRRIQANPQIALSIIGSTAQHLQLLVRQIEQLKAQTGAQRVAEFLLSLSDADRGKAQIALPYEKMLLAGRLGMKKESLSRAFARLRDFGVAVNGPRVTINDVGYLRMCLLEHEMAD